MGYIFLLLLGLISVMRGFDLPASLCLGVGLGAFRGRWTPHQWCAIKGILWGDKEGHSLLLIF